jgi:hypothetical protein
MNAKCALSSLALATTLVLASHGPATAQFGQSNNRLLVDGTYRSDTGAKLVVRSGSIVSLSTGDGVSLAPQRPAPAPSGNTGDAFMVEKTAVTPDGKVTLIGKGGVTRTLPHGTYRGPKGTMFVVAEGKIMKTVDP